MIGLIRVLTTEDPSIRDAHGKQITARYGLTVKSVCIPDQPRGIYDEQSERVATPKVLELAARLEAGGAEAIIISCAADPALQEARRLLKIPVIGAGSAAAGVALTLGERVGVLNLVESTPDAVRSVLGGHLVGEARPAGVRDTTDLLAPSSQEAAAEAARRLVKEKGADVIVLACTGYATVRMADRLRPLLGIPVVDPVDAAGAVAWIATRGKRP